MRFRMTCVLMCLATVVFAQQGKPAGGETPQSGGPEQRLFRGDEPFRTPSPLPPEALSTILATREGKQGLEDAKNRGIADVASRFSATNIHLHDYHQAELLVIGKFPFSGADNDWFWILSPHMGARVLLFCGGNSLEIMKEGTAGYRDVRCIWYGPDTEKEELYRYGGRAYKLSKRSWRTNTH